MHKLQIYLLCLIGLGSCLSLSAQTLTQTIRGTIIDQAGQFPLIGATVALADTDKGVVTDEYGKFRLEKVPIGRYEVIIAYLGYEQQVLPNVVLKSGKELILNIELKESIESLAEVVVTASTDKTGSLNELATVSSRQFTVEEAGRYAGSRGEPTRMAQNYAGVSGSSDSRNDIIIRGNSPLGMLWRFEGLDIPNPNHFALSGSNGGTVSILNLNVLSNSDFLTSAFPADYGNATAGVFDLKMRKGNSEKREYSFQGGALGAEATLEGPFGKNKEASYLVNYRYSTIDIVTSIFPVDVGFSGTPIYQDASFKINLPTKKAGLFSLFGMGGISDYIVDAEERDSSNFDIFFTDNANAAFLSKMGVVGLSHKYIINKTTYINTVIGLSGTSELSKVDSVSLEDSNIIIPWQRNNNKFSKIQVHSFLNKKLSKQLSSKTGFLFSRNKFSVDEKIRDPKDLNLVSFRTGNGNAALWQAYSAWQWRSKRNATYNIGLHYQHFGLNQTNSLEWRFGGRIPLTNGQSAITFGAGLHGQLQTLPLYFVATETDNGITFSNKDLDFTKSQHFVLGLDHNFNRNLRFKGEIYAQFLRQVPIDPASQPSSFSILNEGGDFLITLPPNLVNEGDGQNFGLELTLEKFYSKGYYFLATTSLFKSTFRGSNRQRFSTKFDGGYIFNVLAGKEFQIGKNSQLLFDLKTTLAGGRRFTPIDVAASKAINQPVFLYDQTFGLKHKDYFRTDFKVTFRINRPKLSHEIYFNVDNVFNVSNVFAEYYSTLSQDIVRINQLGLFPTFQYTITF